MDMDNSFRFSKSLFQSQQFSAIGLHRNTFTWSTLIGIVALVAIEIAPSSGIHAISRQKRHSAPRWTIPCGPGQVAIASPISRKLGRIEGVVVEQFQTIYTKAMAIKEKVAQLQELYIATRFGGEEFTIEDMANLQWSGVPSSSLTIGDLHQADVMEMVDEAFSDLAKIAIHMDQTRRDEITYENSQFVPHFMELEEQGIYWLLCELHKLANNLNTDISSDIKSDVESVQIRDVNSRAIRHMRDYIILRQLRGVLYKIASQFA